MKTSVSTHIFCSYIYIFVVKAKKHSPASPVWCSQELGLVRMVDYHYRFLIFKYFKVYPNLNEVVSISPNLIGAVAIYPNVYNTQIW